MFPGCFTVLMRISDNQGSGKPGLPVFTTFLRIRSIVPSPSTSNLWVVRPNKVPEGVYGLFLPDLHDQGRSRTKLKFVSWIFTYTASHV